MSEFGSFPRMSAHEILRFSINHVNMSVRHVALHHERVVISLRDKAPQRNLWELEQAGDTVRITRFPKLRPLDFDGPYGNRFEGSITPELFARIVAAHRPAIVSMVRTTVACLNEGMPSALGLDEQGVKVLEDRRREIQQVASCLFPEDFPR